MSSEKALERFYTDYRRSVIEDRYKELKQTANKKGYWGKTDTVFEVRMKNGKFAARLSGVKGAIDWFDGKLKGYLGFFDAAIVEPEPFKNEEEFGVLWRKICRLKPYWVRLPSP